MDTEKVKELIKLLKEEDLKIITVEDGDEKIHLEANTGEAVAAAGANPVEKNGSETADEGTQEVTATQVGIFYIEKEESGGEKFVEIGDDVSAGDQVGMIEAMKVFNDVTSEVSGTVEEILVDNGEAVEFDQPLMIIRRKED